MSYICGLANHVFSFCLSLCMHHVLLSEHLPFKCSLQTSCLQVFATNATLCLAGFPTYFHTDGASTLALEVDIGMANTSIASALAAIQFVCEGPVPCSTEDTAVNTTMQNIRVVTAVTFTAPGDYNIVLNVQMDTSAVRESGFPVVMQTLNKAIVVSDSHVVKRTVTWQPGTRIPYTAFHPDMPRWLGDPRYATIPGRMWVPLMQVSGTCMHAVLQSKEVWLWNSLLCSGVII